MNDSISVPQKPLNTSDSCCDSPKLRADLTEKQSVAKLRFLEGWALLEDNSTRKLWKTYSLPFKQSAVVVEHIGDICEQFNHHPEITITYDTLTVKWHTYSAGGLTDLDFASAEACDFIVDDLRAG